MNKQHALWIGFLLSALGGCCAPLPEVQPGPSVTWPAPFQQRDLYEGPGVSMLASSPKDAAKGLQRYLKMLEDLGMTSTDMEHPGVLVILGKADSLPEIELQAFFEVLGREPSAESNAESKMDWELDPAWKLDPELKLELELLLALESEQSGTPETAWSEFRENADSKDPRDVFRMGAIPLEVSKLKRCLDWQPSEEPAWAMTLGTASSAASAMERVMDVELKAQGASLFERNILPLTLGLVLPNLRRQTCTRMLLEVAFPQLTSEERKALSDRL